MDKVVVWANECVVLESASIVSVETSKLVSADEGPVRHEIVDGSGKKDGKTSGDAVLISANRGNRGGHGAVILNTDARVTPRGQHGDET